jgi:hypothetical protein
VVDVATGSRSEHDVLLQKSFLAPQIFVCKILAAPTRTTQASWYDKLTVKLAKQPVVLQVLEDDGELSPDPKPAGVGVLTPRTKVRRASVIAKTKTAAALSQADLVPAKAAAGPGNKDNAVGRGAKQDKAGTSKQPSPPRRGKRASR